MQQALLAGAISPGTPPTADPRGSFKEEEFLRFANAAGSSSVPPQEVMRQAGRAENEKLAAAISQGRVTEAQFSDWVRANSAQGLAGFGATPISDFLKTVTPVRGAAELGR